MQSVHQTLLTLSLGAAIILGATDSSSAQVRLSDRPDPAEDHPAYPALPNSTAVSVSAMSRSTISMMASPEVILDAVSSNNYSVTWSNAATVPLLAPNSASLLPTTTPGQFLSLAAVETEMETAVETAVETEQPSAQLAEPATDEAAAPPEHGMGAAEPSVEANETSVSPSLDASDPLEFSADASSPNLEDSPDSEVEGQGEVDVTPSTEAPSVEVDILVPSGAIDVELDSALIDIPDYLLSPSNPLFVPINPETVERIGTQPISLEQALEVARRNSRELQSAVQTLEQSQQALREARAAYLPTVTATSQLVHRDRDISAESGANSLAGQPTVDTTLNLDLTVNYDIFTSGFRVASVRAAENNVRLQELQVEVVQEDLRLNISNAYYDLQDTDERVRIAQGTVEQSLRSVRDASAREEAGVGTRFDLLQAQVQLANDEQDLVNSIRNQSVARRALADALSLPPGIDLAASDPVEVAGGWALPLEASLLLAYRNRAELEQQLVQRELNQAQARAALANRWPQLSAFASYDMNDLLDVTRGTSDFEDLSVGLQLSWTLYNGGATRAAARQEAIAAEVDETTFADTREQIRFEVEQQILSLEANFKNIQTAGQSVDLAKESLRLARLRFSAGVGIQSDVLEAQTQLSEAEGNLVSAVLDYNRALIALQRAVSNWPDNNLSADPIREPLTIRD
ncbi:MAG: TolC family protein [Leptolyngbyaceae cyanobacterium]